MSDGDFLSLDIVRANGTGTDKTYTGELRFDTTFSDTFSTLIGLFASREESDARSGQTLVPAARTANTFSERSGDTYSIFATGLWRFAEEWELSAGVRLDEENREQDSFTTISSLPGVVLTDPHREIDSSEVEPRVSLTRFLTKDAMVYGSVAKGYRGGGFNSASVPPQFSTYGGDTVWTYELGGKASSADGRWMVSSAVYYNDYTDFIGQNALAIGPGGGLVSIDLNLGDVESYGLETEVAAQVTDLWKLSGSVTLMHARITDQSGWLAVTGTPLATDRLLFQPDWNAAINSDVTVPVGMGDVSWNLGVVGKGSRPGLQLRSDDAVDARELHRREHVGHVSPQRLQRQRVREQPVRRGVLRVVHRWLAAPGARPAEPGSRHPGHGAQGRRAAAVRVLMLMGMGAEGAGAPGSAVLRKAAWRLIPLLGVLYFFAFLDRVNVGFAALTMNVDLGLSSAVFGLGAGIFFIGYVAFEVPSNVLLERFGARIWIARIMLSWGVLSAAMAFVQGPTSFYVVRFLLGVAEAGFFPGIIYYLTCWFPARDRARIIALFMIALPLSSVIGAPISTALLGIQSGRPARLAMDVPVRGDSDDRARVRRAALPAGPSMPTSRG